MCLCFCLGEHTDAKDISERYIRNYEILNSEPGNEEPEQGNAKCQEKFIFHTSHFLLFDFLF